MIRKYYNSGKYAGYYAKYNRNAKNNMRGCLPGLQKGIAIVIILLLLLSCKSIKYVPVETVRTEYINRTDTFSRTDTLISERETIIREADSSLVAKLGLQLKNNEKAILILRKELEKQASKEFEHKTDTIIKTDSIQVPYPVKTGLTTGQKLRIGLACFLCSCALAIIIVIVLRLRFKRIV